MSSNDQKVEIRLTKDEALVLFEWLTKTNERNIAETDDVEKQVLCNLEADLEKMLVEPFAENYHNLVAQAKAKIRNNF